MTEIGQPPTLADRLKIWWLKKLDNDSVRQWVPHYNAAWLSWALLATFLLPPVPTVYEAMGPPAYWMWVWFAIIANSTPMIGLWMRHGGSSFQAMTTKLLKQDWYGLYLQAAGHALAHVLLLMFEVSAIITVFTYDGPALYAGLTVFVAFMLAPWCEGTLLLCAQCLRKVQRGFQLEHQDGVM